MTPEALLNAYIDANLVLICATLFWAVARIALRGSTLRQAYGAQLRLIYSVLAAIALLPPLLVLLNPVLQPALANHALHVRLTDIAVAQFLDGNIAMAPSQFEQLLLVRDQLVHETATLASDRGRLLAAVLGALLLGAVVRTVWNAVHLHRFVQASYLWRRSGRVELRLTDASHVPFSTRGLWRFYIVLPASMLSNTRDLRVAIAHELQHIRQGDLTWELLLEGLRPLFVLNPVFRLWKHQVERLRELACDQQVLARRGIPAHDYCACLLRVCATALAQRHADMRHPAVALITLAPRGRGRAAERFLRLRVTNLLSHAPHHTARHGAIALFLAPLTIAIALSVMALQPGGDWSQDRLMLSTIVNLERLNLRNGSPLR